LGKKRITGLTAIEQNKSLELHPMRMLAEMVEEPKKGKCPTCGILTLIYIDSEVHTEWCEDCGWEHTVSWNELGTEWWYKNSNKKSE